MKRIGLAGLWNKKRSLFLLGVIIAASTIFSACGVSGADQQTETMDTGQNDVQNAGTNNGEETMETEERSSFGTEKSGDNITVPESDAERPEEAVLKMTIGDTPVSVEWEVNESAAALKDLAADGPLLIQMSMYSTFEQVGSLGSDLPRNDAQTTTQAGDIVLYSGNQIVVFYGSNSWSYTRFGHITDKTEQELAELLGNGDVTITILVD